MELIDGISLQDKIDRKGPLSLKEILRIGLQTAEGLAAAHKQGLVHRESSRRTSCWKTASSASRSRLRPGPRRR